MILNLVRNINEDHPLEKKRLGPLLKEQCFKGENFSEHLTYNEIAYC